MASSLDIFGLCLGAAYAALAPIVAYLFLRTRLNLKLRDIALGAVGYFAGDALYRLVVKHAVDALITVWQNSGYHPYLFAFFFIEDWSFRLAFAVQNDLLCFLLLSLFASRSKGLGPGAAYAIGAYGVYSIAVRALVEFHRLQLANETIEKGAESVFGSRANSPDFLTQMFSYGIPYGVASVTQLLIAIGLSILVWRGVRDKNWTWVCSAILIHVGMQAPYSLMAALMAQRYVFNIFDCALGVVLVGLLYWRRPILGRLANILPIGRGRQPLSIAQAGEPIDSGLLSAWIEQSRRDDRKG